MRLKFPTRNQFALAIAALSGVAAVGSAIMAVVSIWSGDGRWLQTAGVSIGLAIVLYVIGYLMYTEPEKP